MGTYIELSAVSRRYARRMGLGKSTLVRATEGGSRERGPSDLTLLVPGRRLQRRCRVPASLDDWKIYYRNRRGGDEEKKRRRGGKLPEARATIHLATSLARPRLLILQG